MLVSAKEMLQKARDEKYAVGQFNINNLEWTKAVLLTAEENNSPVILGVSEGAGKYMGGYKTVVGMVKGMINELGITVGKDNKLTLDETKWANAHNSTKTALFNGRQGFAEKMVYKASQMTNSSAEKASYTASAYKDNGDYTEVNAKSMYEDLF